MFEVDETVRFTYNAYNLLTDEFIGTVDVTATITRIWNGGRYLSLLTDDGKHFVRHFDSPSIEKV